MGKIIKERRLMLFGKNPVAEKKMEEGLGLDENFPSVIRNWEKMLLLSLLLNFS